MEVSVLWLTYQARYVRVNVSHRAIRTSGDSPCRFSTKDHLLDTCLLLMMPFRVTLLTLWGGPQCLDSKVQEVPAHLLAFLHSYTMLSRRTAMSSSSTHNGIEIADEGIDDKTVTRGPSYGL